MGDRDERRKKELMEIMDEVTLFPAIKKSQQIIDSFISTIKNNKRYIITDGNGEPYLERMFLKDYPDGSKDMLHIIYKSDDDRDHHDHPHNFQSRIVHGTYINHMSTGSVTYGPGQTNVMRASDAHRLEVLDGPVVTIVHRGPKIRDWGFHTINGWIHHKEYLDKKFGVGKWVSGD